MGSRATVAVLATLVSVACAPAGAEAKPGDLYVGSAGNGKVIRINPNTGRQHVVVSGQGLDSPDSGAFTKGGDLVVADYGAQAVFRVDPKKHTVKALASGGPLVGPTDAAITPDGSIYTCDPFAGAAGTGAVYRIAHGKAHLVADKGFLHGPLGLVSDGNTLITSNQGTLAMPDGALIRVSPKSGHQDKLASGQHLVDPYGMTLSPSGKVAYTADTKTGSIVRVKLANGHQRVVASGTKLGFPTDVAMGLDGKLYVVNDDIPAKVLKVNPKTGHVAVVTKNGKLDFPEGITVEPAASHHH